MQQDKMSVQCRKNRQCTGVDCSGTYTLSGGVIGKLIDVELCFGIFIHPCATTTEMSVYADFLEPENSSFIKVFKGNDSAEIPGSRINLQSAGQAVGVLDVTMVPRRIHSKPYMLAGVRFKIRVSIGSYQFWPQMYQMTLVPDVLIPIPVCEKSVMTPTHSPTSCRQRDVPTVTSQKVPLSTSLPGRECKVNEMNSCQNRETCKADDINSTHGHCVCSTGAEYNHVLQVCQETQLQTTPVPVFEYPDLEPAKTVSKNVIIIASCSVGGILVVSGILLVIVFKYRAHRARYGDRQPLATEDFQEDEDDDEPLAI